jgi:hypothetical protein
MIRWKSLIFCWNSSRVGNAISDSSLIGVPSCFLRRAQDGEVDEIDAGVGFQQVAPGALAGVRLARDEQHAKLVAHAVDGNDGAVVDRGEFVFERRGFDLDDVLSGVRDRDLRVDGSAGRDGAAVEHFTVAPDGNLGRCRRGALVLDAIDDGLRLADDAEARRRHQHHAAVAFVAGAGDKRMDRRADAQRRDLGRDIVHASVGEHDCARHAVGRHVGQHGAQRREQPRAVGLAVGFAGFDEAHVETRDAAEPLGQQRARGLGLLEAVAEILARALVDHHRHDRGQRLAILARERRVRQRQHHHGESERRARPAAAPRKRQQSHEHDRNRDRHPQHIGRNQRREVDAETHVAFLLSQPFQQRRDVDLVGLVVAGERVHHDVDAGAERRSRAGAARPAPAAAWTGRRRGSPRRRRNRSR